MNTTLIGNRTEGFVLSALMAAGYNVLIPFGGGLRYDLAIDTADGIKRVQCKTARVRPGAGAIYFPTMSWRRDSKEPVKYRGHVDFFGVYCQQSGKCYLVPISDVKDREATLRLEKPKNGQSSGVRWAADYEISSASSSVGGTSR